VYGGFFRVAFTSLSIKEEKVKKMIVNIEVPIIFTILNSIRFAVLFQAYCL